MMYMQDSCCIVMDDMEKIACQLPWFMSCYRFMEIGKIMQFFLNCLEFVALSFDDERNKEEI